MTLRREDVWAIARGRSWLRGCGDEDLENDPAMWRALWAKHHEEIVADWTREHAGSRPPAWHEFEPIARERKPDESEVAFLDRMALIGDQEQEAIADHLRGLAQYNEDRDPARNHNYIAIADLGLSDLFEYCEDRDLLTDEELEILTREPTEADVDNSPRIVQHESEVVDVEDSQPSPQPRANRTTRNYLTDGRRSGPPRYDDRPRPVDTF
jgi:hypothetical protein